MVTERTPEELWNLAQNSTDSYQRIRYYEQIVEKFPDNKYAPEALFMIGFAEELKSRTPTTRQPGDQRISQRRGVEDGGVDGPESRQTAA